MELATQIFQFILSISILVILHELGHFLPAKWFKCRVEKFYLFFDPWFSLAKKKIGETEYGIGWLPFGGYVKIAGMVDESMDTEQLKQPAQPWEFRSKTAWQRLIIMLGGIFVNLILAWAIYTGLNLSVGEKYHDLAKFENGIAVSEEGAKMGLMNGDKILKIDGKPAVRMENSMINMLLANEITVLRNGKEVAFAPKEDGIAHILGSKTAKLYITNRFAPVVDSLTEGPGKQAGLQKGDQIVALNGKNIRFYDELTDGLAGKKNQPITIDVLRNNEVKTFSLNTDKDGKIGFRPDFKPAEAAFEKTVTNQEYSFLPAVGRGFERTVESLTMQIKQFKLMFNKKIKGYKNVGGPIAIVKMMPKEIDWVAFWSFTAMFSAWLAFLNLLPIPGLDGGHALFTTWEIITGKPVPQKVLENAQMIGVIFLMGLMLLIFGSDIYKFIISPFLK
ncbi:RIP metalloprotease RseP [Cloacibacterium sp. TD35]|uniref:RIP metalloprotease RseP n=1 Tax=Cloacibacterium sp. TD35 TaxID=2976818 RepID=UPI00237DD134|nr:RIP metalloprotease RseP [Cloacibacterium sp. TD35]WDT68502.1 RIP metalloprotease RseP [Cloacibacterium sp. TD35]